MAEKEGGHVGLGQDKSWLAQSQSGKLLPFRQYSVCALVGKGARILRMSLHSSSDVPAAITWMSAFIAHTFAFTIVSAGDNLFECPSLRPPSSTPAHRCTTRVSVGCAPKWTAIPLSRHAAVSQADMDETGTTPPLYTCQSAISR